MKTKRFAFGLLVLTLLACNFVTQLVIPPTATPLPTLTPTATASPIPTATQLSPAYIPPQCAGRPIATLSPELSIEPTPVYVTEPISKREQLRILNDIEQVVERVYIYPDYNGKDWEGIVAGYREKINAGLDTDAFYIEMRNMVDELGDDHSAFISPIDVQLSEAELRGENEFVGVGINSEADFDRGRLIIISTFPGSPAELSGIQSHDSVLRINGLPISAENRKLLRGPECTAVVFTIQSPDEAPRDVMLIRTKVEGSIPIDARMVKTSDGSRIGYIFIPSFFDETLPPQIENALKEFGELDGLILDVRLNGGGSTTVAYPILSFFTDGKLGDFVSRTESEPMVVEANPINNSQIVPLVVMVSEDTVSFGEIFAGLMRDARGAKITGETSLGNVEVLNGFDLEDGSVIWIAAATFDSAFSDENWEETGIVPDLQAYAPWDTFYFDTDPSIAAALELLGHQ